MSDQLRFEGFEPTEAERIEARRILNGGLAGLLGIGAENAIPTERLAQRLFTDRRAVTIAVYDLRRAGVPVCSSGEGYFLPRCEAEVTACFSGLKKRAREIDGSADAILSGWWAGWRPPEVEAEQ